MHRVLKIPKYRCFGVLGRSVKMSRFGGVGRGKLGQGVGAWGVRTSLTVKHDLLHPFSVNCK